MKYVANPVVVDAFKITEVHAVGANTVIVLENENGRELDASMTARYIPKIGDYLVRAEDGYEYLNPKEVFERKYVELVE